MCTAINIFGKRHLFGRTFDYEHDFGQKVISLPRSHRAHRYEMKYSIIGVGLLIDGEPLMFDGMNEFGLCGAALNFPFGSVYHSCTEGALNLASYELLAYILGNYSCVDEAEKLLSGTNITAESFSGELLSSPLHWIFADSRRALTVESVSEGLKIYENRVGVLTNSPCFDYQMTRLSDYMPLNSPPPENRLTGTSLAVYSRGMGAIGLPGDFSSVSRFVRGVFLKEKILTKNRPTVSDFLHITDSLAIPRGCVMTENGEPVSTIYTTCADTSEGIYYFTTYGCRAVFGVRHDKEAKAPISYPMSVSERISLM